MLPIKAKKNFLLAPNDKKDRRLFNDNHNRLPLQKFTFTFLFWLGFHGSAWSGEFLN